MSIYLTKTSPNTVTDKATELCSYSLQTSAHLANKLLLAFLFLCELCHLFSELLPDAGQFLGELGGLILGGCQILLGHLQGRLHLLEL